MHHPLFKTGRKSHTHSAWVHSFRQQTLDHGMAVGLMLTLEHETAFECFKAALAGVGTQYARLDAIVDIGVWVGTQYVRLYYTHIYLQYICMYITRYVCHTQRMHASPHIHAYLPTRHISSNVTHTHSSRMQAYLLHICGGNGRSWPTVLCSRNMRGGGIS